MLTVNMHEAKTRLSKLVEAVESGAESEIVIARNGKPAVRIMPMASVKKKGFPIGIGKGKFELPNDFDDHDAEVEAIFYDEPLFPPE